MRIQTMAIIGVGNMAKAVISGIVCSEIPLSAIVLYDKNPAQYKELPVDSRITFVHADTVEEAVSAADCVLLSVKPQNYGEVLACIEKVTSHAEKIYISIGAGITSESVSRQLGNASVVRVLPNVPMLIGHGVSVVCENPAVPREEFEFICSLFRSAGSIVRINENEMNPMIGVTSSSPAYVFRFINAIYQGALAQGLPDRQLLDSICDVVIGSALLLKESEDSPQELIAKVASKGGTTEQALQALTNCEFDRIVADAMKACTKRADELGALKK